MALGFGNVLFKSKFPASAVSKAVNGECEKNIAYKLMRAPNDTYWPELKNIYDSVKAPKFLNAKGLRKTYVAVLDTGIDSLHKDLQGKFDLSLGFNAANFADRLDSSDIYDRDGHGTHISGIIA